MKFDLRSPAFTLAIIFIISFSCLITVYFNFPNLEPSEKRDLKLPTSFQDAERLGTILLRYTDRYYFYVLAGVLVTYIFLQSFAIPGSIFLTILAGYMFPFPLALILVCICSAIGASLCYILSDLVGRTLVLKFIPHKVAEWSSQVEKQRDNLLCYMIFLRITPIFPNWFINITSPIIGVPFLPFFLGTLVGVAPPSSIAIIAGKTLKIAATPSLFTWNSAFWLTLAALASLIPVIHNNLQRKKSQKA